VINLLLIKSQANLLQLTIAVLCLVSAKSWLIVYSTLNTKF